MSLSLYQVSVPVYQRGLNAFLGVLDKAEEHAAARKFDPANYLTIKLSPDMFPLARQIQSFCDHAKNSSFRLAGQQPPVMDDKETTIAELRQRIHGTLDLLKSIDPKAMEAARRGRSSSPPARASSGQKAPIISYISQCRTSIFI